jgi:hypothetical protein
MAIAFVTSADSGNTGSASSNTFAFDATATNGLLVVGGLARESGRTVSGITYNGVAMTEIGTQVSTGLGAPYYDKIFLFYLPAPTTGSNNVVITYTGSGHQGAWAALFSGVLQSGTVLEVNNDIAVASSNTMTGSATNGTNGGWVMHQAHWFNAGQTASTNSTIVANCGGNGTLFTATDNPAGASESVSMTTTSGSTENRMGKMAGFAPADEARSITINESVTITESVTLTHPIPDISATDAVTITEALTITHPIPDISVTDTQSITESVSLFTDAYNLSVTDTQTITESVSLVISDAYLVNVTDTQTMTESLTLTNAIPDISVTDTQTITETVTVTMPLNIDVTDTMTMSESVSLDIPYVINVTDTMTMTESVSGEVFDNITVSDTITITDSVTVTSVRYSPGLKMPGGMVNNRPVGF